MQNISHRQKLKARILEAATSMFVEQGIRMVRMDDIARSLSISKRTLYEIYDNKEELLMDVVKTGIERDRNRISTLLTNGANPIEVIFEGYRQRLKQFSSINPQFFEDINTYESVKNFLREKRRSGLFERIDFFEKGVGQGYFIAGVDYKLLNTIIDGAMQYIMSEKLYTKNDVKDMFRSSVMILLRGVCTPHGLKQLDSLMQNLTEKK